MDPTFTFKAVVWLWQSKTAWHFISFPSDLSADIKGFDGPRRGFGSIRVKVTIGLTTWKTSIFPEKKGAYILPIKADVRKEEGITEGDAVQVEIALQ